MNIRDLSCLYNLYQQISLENGKEHIVVDDNKYYVYIYNGDILAAIDEDCPSRFYYSRIGGMSMINELFTDLSIDRIVNHFTPSAPNQ